MTKQLLRFLLVPACVLSWSVAAAHESHDPSVVEVVPLPDHELRQITVSLLEQYPQLAGSPGVKVSGKVSGAYEGSPGTEAANVIYYPHIEGRGVRAAVEAHCHRTQPSTTWVCDDVRNRRYLQVAAQAFEVRLLAEISSDAAIALVEASRRDLNSTANDVSTAILIHDYHDRPGQYFVSWGTPDGFTKVTLLAELARGGSPTNPNDWHASIFEPPSPE